jgi:hypothetical protein
MHDPRYRTSAAFALAVGVNRFLLRVLTFLPVKEVNSVVDVGLWSNETTEP